MIKRHQVATPLAAFFCTFAISATAQDFDPTSLSTYGSKPNIILIVSDDTGYWDLGAYHGGAARGMDTPTLIKWPSRG